MFFIKLSPHNEVFFLYIYVIMVQQQDVDRRKTIKHTGSSDKTKTTESCCIFIIIVTLYLPGFTVVYCDCGSWLDISNFRVLALCLIIVRRRATVVVVVRRRLNRSDRDVVRCRNVFVADVLVDVCEMVPAWPRGGI